MLHLHYFEFIMLTSHFLHFSIRWRTQSLSLEFGILLCLEEESVTYTYTFLLNSNITAFISMAK